MTHRTGKPDADLLPALVLRAIERQRREAQRRDMVVMYYRVLRRAAPSGGRRLSAREAADVIRRKHGVSVRRGHWVRKPAEVLPTNGFAAVGSHPGMAGGVSRAARQRTDAGRGDAGVFAGAAWAQLANAL